MWCWEKKESAHLKLTKQTIIRGKADRKGSRVSQWVKCSVKYPEDAGLDSL